jgi:hypothetical protein
LFYTLILEYARAFCQLAYYPATWPVLSPSRPLGAPPWPCAPASREIFLAILLWNLLLVSHSMPTSISHRLLGASDDVALCTLYLRWTCVRTAAAAASHITASASPSHSPISSSMTRVRSRKQSPKGTLTTSCMVHPPPSSAANLRAGC